MFNDDQIMSLVRSITAIASGWLVGHGYQTESDSALYSGFVLSLAPIVWGMYAKREDGLIASAATVPDAENKLQVHLANLANPPGESPNPKE